MQATWSGSSLEAYCHQVETCTKIALNCMQQDSQKRPNVLQIIDELNKIETAIGKVSKIIILFRVKCFFINTYIGMLCQ